MLRFKPSDDLIYDVVGVYRYPYYRTTLSAEYANPEIAGPYASNFWRSTTVLPSAFLQLGQLPLMQPSPSSLPERESPNA
jgi:hypothetical protein